MRPGLFTLNVNERMSYLQSSVQNIVIACPQTKSPWRGGGHSDKDSMNNDTEIFEK